MTTTPTPSEIWFLTVLTPRPMVAAPTRKTWGWFATREKAEKALLENASLYYGETGYAFAVLEAVAEGSATLPREQRWYRVEVKSVLEVRLKPIDRPGDELGPIWSRE
jgi:hypothetical protein